MYTGTMTITNDEGKIYEYLVFGVNGHLRLRNAKEGKEFNFIEDQPVILISKLKFDKQTKKRNRRHARQNKRKTKGDK